MFKEGDIVEVVEEPWRLHMDGDTDTYIGKKGIVRYSNYTTGNSIVKIEGKINWFRNSEIAIYDTLEPGDLPGLFRGGGNNAKN